MICDYVTKRIAPNNTEYRFFHGRLSFAAAGLPMSVIKVVRVHSWYRRNETILYREMINTMQASEFFQGLLDCFPRDALYKE